MPLALLAVLVASAVAMTERNLKRLLAYSSVAQIGYIMLGASLVSAAGVSAGILHLFNHALAKGALFLTVACLAMRCSGLRLEELGGCARRMPWTMGAFVVAGLSLIGVPGTAGFISKWYLILALLESNLWPVAALLLISSLLALVYVWRVIEVAYFRPPPEDQAEIREAPLGMLVPTWILIGASLFFGVFTRWSAGLARIAAETLLGGGP